MKLSCPLVDGY